MRNKNIMMSLAEIQRDEELRGAIIVGLDRSCEAMLGGAYRLTTDGELVELAWETMLGDDEGMDIKYRKMDEASIFENDAIVVKIHLTRPTAKDGYKESNGVRVDDEETSAGCIVFVNIGGSGPLSAEGTQLKHGEYMVHKECSLDDPEVQAAMVKFMQSKTVRKEIASLREELNGRKNSQ